MTSRPLTVLGTDTDAGKTTFSLLWLAAFGDSWDYWKPLETGDSDSERVRQLLPGATVYPPIGRFREPVAPPLAARREGVTIPDAGTLAGRAPTPRHSARLLVETFGGPFSPLNESQLQWEFVAALGGDAVLVTSSAVGAVGRTLQTLAALGTVGVAPKAVALVGARDEYAEDEIRKHRPGVAVVALEMFGGEWDPPAIHAAASANRAALEAVRAAVAPPHAAADWPRRDRAAVWHPYSPLDAGLDPVAVFGAQREFLHLADGRPLIDATSSWWTILHGHRHPPLIRALHEAAETLDHVLFAGATHPAAVGLAEALLGTIPWGEGGRVFFSDNGSTAVEAALKMALQYWQFRGEKRPLFVGFENGYHGDTVGAMSVGRDPVFFGRFESLLFPVARLPLDPQRLDDFLTTQRGQVAAVVVEPLLQMASGVRTHSSATLRDLAEVARRHTLFIADEVMTGARTGRRWACDHAGVAPDLLCASKTITGGLMPLGATLAAPEVVEVFRAGERREGPGARFFHSHSFTGHPLACAVALANERILAQPGVLARADAVGGRLFAALEPLRNHPRVADVRRCGSAVAVEVRAEGGYLAAEADGWRRLALARGVLLRPLGNVLYALPPLGSSEASLDRIAAVIAECAAG